MKLADISIARPVFATMMIVALVVLGLFSYTRLNIDQFPDVDVPVVSIMTVLPGAGPEQVETELSQIIEDAVNPIGGVDHIQSQSLEGVSIVTIIFELEVDGKEAAQEVREKVAAIRNEFPLGTEEPVISRYDPASQPIMSLSISSERTDEDLTTYTDDVIRKQIESVPGVGAVDLVGGFEREVHINVNAEKLQAYGLSINDVITEVSAANYELPGGYIEQGPRKLLLRTSGRYKSVEQFSQTIILSDKNHAVRLADVADVAFGGKDKESLSRYNGRSAIALNIRKQSGANTVEVADKLNKELERLQSRLPNDISLEVSRDNSEFIRHSVDDILFDIVWGGLLAIFVVYLFLANIRSTIISALALPTSIIATFTLMYALDFTLNIMTLMGLSLAVGLLIDDAIVVIENIYRHMHEGESPHDAAQKGTAEIGMAVLAVTFTLVAVFVPVAFMQGIVGRFFYEFGLTISVAVLASLFVAFTLTPMLSSQWLSKEDEELTNTGGPIRRGLYWFNHAFAKLADYYRNMLDWALSHRKTVLLGSVTIFLGSMYLFNFVGSEFFPSYDQGELTINMTAPQGSSLEETDAIARYVESRLKEWPEVEDVMTTIGAGNASLNEGSIFVRLVSKDERLKTAKEITVELRDALKNIPGTILSFDEGGGPGGGEKPVAYSVRGPELAVVQDLAKDVQRIVTNTAGTVDVETSQESTKPELVVNIDRNRASDLGVKVNAIAATIRSAVDGNIATKFQEGDNQYDVRVRLRPEDRHSEENVAMLNVKSSHKLPNGKDALVRLSDIGTVNEKTGPSQINRYDRQKEIQITSNLSGRLLGEALGDASAEIAKLDIPAGYIVGVVGQGETQTDAFANILISLALAIVFVYIILAMQFESFIQPISIMMSLPMAIIGAVLSLLIFNESVSIMSLIGIIMLMGLVTKNAILLVDYTNTLRARDMKRTEALLLASKTRLRPILMTTFAMIFGMLPVAMAFGEGSEFRAPMGITVIGGLITSTLLTLFIVPVFYTYLDDLSWKRIISPLTWTRRKTRFRNITLK